MSACSLERHTRQRLAPCGSRMRIRPQHEPGATCRWSRRRLPSAPGARPHQGDAGGVSRAQLPDATGGRVEPHPQPGQPAGSGQGCQHHRYHAHQAPAPGVQPARSRSAAKCFHNCDRLRAALGQAKVHAINKLSRSTRLGPAVKSFRQKGRDRPVINAHFPHRTKAWSQQPILTSGRARLPNHRLPAHRVGRHGENRSARSPSPQPMMSACGN